MKDGSILINNLETKLGFISNECQLLSCLLTLNSNNYILEFNIECILLNKKSDINKFNITLDYNDINYHAIINNENNILLSINLNINYIKIIENLINCTFNNSNCNIEYLFSLIKSIDSDNTNQMLNKDNITILISFKDKAYIKNVFEIFKENINQNQNHNHNSIIGCLSNSENSESSENDNNKVDNYNIISNNYDNSNNNEYFKCLDITENEENKNNSYNCNTFYSYYSDIINEECPDVKEDVISKIKYKIKNTVENSIFSVFKDKTGNNNNINNNNNNNLNYKNNNKRFEDL